MLLKMGGKRPAIAILLATMTWCSTHSQPVSTARFPPLFPFGAGRHVAGAAAAIPGAAPTAAAVRSAAAAAGALIAYP